MYKNNVILKYVITTNLVIIVIITFIFSGWRVYSTNIWLEELKNYIEYVTKEVKEYEKQNTKLLYNNENNLIKDQELAKESNKLQLIILKELQDFKNKNLNSQNNIMKKFERIENLLKNN